MTKTKTKTNALAAIATIATGHKEERLRFVARLTEIYGEQRRLSEEEHILKEALGQEHRQTSAPVGLAAESVQSTKPQQGPKLRSVHSGSARPFEPPTSGTIMSKVWDYLRRHPKGVNAAGVRKALKLDNTPCASALTTLQVHGQVRKSGERNAYLYHAVTA